MALINISTLLPTITAMFVKSVRAQALLTRVVNRSLDPAPAQKGDTVNLRLPVSVAPVAVTASAAPVAPQASSTTPVTLTLDQWYERSMGLTDKENSEIEDGNVPQQLSQMAIDLVEFINVGGYQAINAKAGFAFNDTPSNLPYATDDSFFRNALAQMDLAKAPSGGRYAIHNPAAYWGGLALPNIAQSDRRGVVQSAGPLVTGQVGGYLGVPFMGDALIASAAQTTAALGAGALTANGVNAAGATSISIAKGAGANVALVAGDVIKIAGHARNYVVSAPVTVVQAANTTVTINGGLAIATVGGEAITLIGAGSTYNNSAIFHSDAVMFCSRPLEDLKGSAETYSLTDPQTGLTIRGEITRQNRQTKVAFDCLWGWQVVRPLHVGRILG